MGGPFGRRPWRRCQVYRCYIQSIDRPAHLSIYSTILIPHTTTHTGGWVDVREALKAKAEALGFARARITTPEPAARLDAYKAWVAEGKHGTMG